MADRFSGGSPEWGDDELAWGDDLLRWGEPVTTISAASSQRLTPEQVIVAACRSCPVPAYPVFQVGDPVLPSVVFACTGVIELEGFQRKLTRQTFAITIRHETYGGVVMLTERVHKALRCFPGNRFRGVSGFSDGYGEPDFAFRTRVMNVIIER